MPKLTPEELQLEQQKAQLKKRMEMQKKEVEALEITARYWEAQWKIRFYTLEAEKLQPDYNAFLEAQKKQQEEAIKRFQEQIDQMNKEAAEQQQAKEDAKTIADNQEFLHSISKPLTAV